MVRIGGTVVISSVATSTGIRCVIIITVVANDTIVGNISMSP